MRVWMAVCLLFCAVAGAEVFVLEVPGPQGLALDFRGTSWQEHKPVLVEWLAKQGVSADDPAGQSLAEMLARWTRPAAEGGKPVTSGKYAAIFIGAFNKMQGIRHGFRGTKLPPELCDVLVKDLAWRGIESRLELDWAAEGQRTKSIPPGGTMVTAATHGELAPQLEKAYPGWAALDPAARHGRMLALAAMNPALRPSGWYRLPAGQTSGETWPHVIVPIADGSSAVVLWSPRYGGHIYLPPASALADAKPAGPPADPPVEAIPASHVLVLDDFIGKAIPLQVQISLQGSNWLSGAAVASTVSNAVYPVYPFDPAAPMTAGGRGNKPLVLPPGERQSVKLAGRRLVGLITVKLPALGKTMAGGDQLVDLDVDLATRQGSYDVISGKEQPRRAVLPGPAPAPQVFNKGASWSSWLGTDGTAAAQPGAGPLVDDLEDARMVWVSDDHFSNGRGPNTRGKAVAVPLGRPLSGSYATPVVADGKVVMFDYVPSGKAMAYGASADNERLRLCRIEADDTLTCLDLATGRTVWKRRWPQSGLNWAGFNKGGPKLSAAISGNRVVAVGTTGKVWCVDRASGATLWQSDIGARHEQMENMRSRNLAEKSLLSTRNDFMFDAIIAGDVVVLCDSRHTKIDYRYEIASGVIALDLATGKQRWALPEVGSVSRFNQGAQVWKHEGKTYVVVAHGKGTSLVESVTGRVLWTVEDARMYQEGLGFCGDMMLAESPAVGAGLPGIVGVKLSPQAGKVAWRLEGLSGLQGGAAGDDGRFYLTATGPKRQIHIVEAATGKVLASTPAAFAGGEHCPFTVTMDKRIIMPTDRTDAYIYASADPAKLAGSVRYWAADLATGYCGAILPALVDGRMIVRMQDFLVCYDLRQASAKPYPDGGLWKRMPAPAMPANEKPAEE